MSEHTNPYGVSFIQTAAGAVITGEIVRFKTYKEMCESTNISPTRLASVANASHDEDYDVPPDHEGGVLYQRDTISNTWVLLYSEKDLAVPTYVNWERILNVPKWVGGITHNRVKLTENRFAELRTTYYSFGQYNLIMPRPDETKVVRGETVYAFDLGEEVVLEQYDNVGAILIPYVEGDILTETSEVMSVDGNWYQVIYTYAPSSSRLQDGDIRTTKHAYAFRLICTEDDNGKRYWTLCTTNDEAVNAITALRKDQTDHILAENPHNQYVRKLDLRHYLLSATTKHNGLVTLAVRSDIDSQNTTKAVTPYLLKNYVEDVITYRCDILDRKIQSHIGNTDIHITIDDKNKIMQHIDDLSSHVSPEDRRKWNKVVSTIEESSGSDSVEEHNAAEDAHYDLFNSKLDKNTFDIYFGTNGLVYGWLAAKQDNLTESQYIKLVRSSDPNNPTTTIDCTLHAGSGITIDNNGTISCDVGTVQDATTSQKGIVRLIDTIVDPDDDTTALTPKAIKDLRSIVNSLFTANSPAVTCTKTAVEEAELYDGHHVFKANWKENSKDPVVQITTKFLLPRIALANADYTGTYWASDIYIGMWTATGTKAMWNRRRILRNLHVYYNIDTNTYYFYVDVVKASDNTIESQLNLPIPVDGTKRAILSKEDPGKSHDTTKISLHIWMDASYVYIQGYVYAYGEEKDAAEVIVRYDPNVQWTWVKNNS